MEGRYKTGSGCKVQLALGEKYMLTIKEATEYFNIGSKALRRLAESHTDEFAIIMGNRYLIIREKFEEYILNCIENKGGRIFTNEEECE